MYQKGETLATYEREDLAARERLFSCIGIEYLFFALLGRGCMKMGSTDRGGSSKVWGQRERKEIAKWFWREIAHCGEGKTRERRDRKKRKRIAKRKKFNQLNNFEL